MRDAVSINRPVQLSSVDTSDRARETHPEHGGDPAVPRRCPGYEATVIVSWARRWY